MNVLLFMFLMRIPPIFPALTFRGSSESPATQFLIPKYPSIPLFSRISRSDIPRTIFFKNLLELDCVRQIYNQNNYKKPSRRFEIFKNQAQMPHAPFYRYRGNTFNNKLPGLVRQNQNQGVNNPPGDGKFLLTPISYSTINYHKPLMYPKNWKKFPSSENFFKPNFKEEIKIHQMKSNESNINVKEEIEKIKIENSLHQKEKKPSNIDKYVKNSINILKSSTNQSNSEEGNNKLKHNEVKKDFNVPVAIENSTSSKAPLHFYHFPRPKIIQPYEVEEIIEEDIRVDVKNEKGNDSENLNLNEQEIYDNEMELIDDEPETSSQKTNNVMQVLDNSINKILKGLIQPPLEKEKHKQVTESKEKDAITTWVVPNEFKESPNIEKKKVTIIPPFLSTTISKYFSNNLYNEKEKFDKTEALSNSNRNLENRAKSLTLQNDKKKIMQNASSANENPEIWRLHPVDTKWHKQSPDSNDFENVKDLKIFEEKKKNLLNSRDPSEMEPKLHLADLFKFYNDAKSPRTEPLPSLPELFAYSIHPQNRKEPITKDGVQLPNLQPNDSLYGQTFSILPNNDSNFFGDVLPSTPKQFTSKKNINELPSTSTTKSQVIHHDERPVKKDFFQSEKTNFSEWKQINTQLQLDKNNKNGKNLTEFEQTSKETTKVKLNFDLIPVTSISKVDNIDLSSKNNHKMIYGQDLDNSLDEVTEQRRSDILINEALNDYEENLKENSSLNYLKILKENILEKNFSINFIVPFIPIIMNDIREEKLSPEEILLISKAMGKYWPSILALSNSTNFDMLPLLKMKNEKDLEKFLENSLKDERVEKTTLESVYDLTNDMYFSENYDYDYKDLYQDITVEDLDFKRKKKFRPVREVGNHLEHLKNKNTFFYELENTDIIEETESNIRIKRSREDEDWKAEATREYFESLEKENNENAGDYLYDEIYYSDLAEDKELIQAELVEASNLQVSFQNLTSSVVKK